MPTKLEAVANFLEAYSNDLSIRYHAGMECQINVAQDGGDRVDGEYKGRRWQGWSDGLTTWKPFRIPWKAGTNPEFTDTELKFDLAEHVEAIGMTGWNWESRCSEWVAFDFDALMGHSEKHRARNTDAELKEIIAAASAIPWVTIVKSASGNGIHLYVYLNSVPTDNHTEHAALARAIIGKMSACAGYDFGNSVDTCGGNMWIWHRKSIGTDGFKVVKHGIALIDIPPNWKDHIKVVTGQRRKNLPNMIPDAQVSAFEQLCGQRPQTKLDTEHKRLTGWLQENDALWWWDQDHHMLVTHTMWVKRAHEELGLIGVFDTNSDGKNLNEQNCFMFPLRGGAWTVRRYTRGIQEALSWDQDGQGWTTCFLNRSPDLPTSAKACGGLEDPAGGFVFREASEAMKAANLLGVNATIGTPLQGRKTTLKPHKSGRLQIEIKQEQDDRAEDAPGFLVKKGFWVKMFSTQAPIVDEPEVGVHDDIVRHLVSGTQEDCGWVLRADGSWITEPKTNIADALASTGLTPKEARNIVGSSIFKPWKIVNLPFQPEYPGDRCWNQNAAQLRYTPLTDTDNLHFPHWDKLLEHCGAGLTNAVSENPWCKANGLKTGADYLRCWVASLLQYPAEPLPYLFFWSKEQNTGKSSFHEALALLMTKGYQQADLALTSPQGFNGELEGAILCFVEEVDLSKSATAYNRIKEWVTGRQINIRHLYRGAFHVPNTTHWVQCANDHQYCPVFPGDTRITISYVSPLKPTNLVPKGLLMELLEKEATHFITAIMALEVPESNDRLRIPVLETDDKAMISQQNASDLQVFIESTCNLEAAGQKILFSEFYSKFIAYLDRDQRGAWSKIKVGKSLPPQILKARCPSTNQVWLANVMWQDGTLETGVERYTSQDGVLIAVPHD